MSTDIFLVKQAKNGNQEAFIKLIQNYEEILFNMARKFLKNEQDIDDVLQETALIAYQKIDQIKKPKYFNTWICRILINQCKTIMKKDDVYELLENYQLTVDSNEDEHLILSELLKELNQIYCIPLVLYYYNGFSIKEISEILEEPLGTIKSRLSRGKALLKKEYEQFGGTASEEI